MTSLIRRFEYKISSVSLNYLLEGEEIWKISLWRNPVLLAGATFSTVKVKHFFMQSKGGPCQDPAISADEWPHRSSPGIPVAGEGQLQQGREGDVENISPGDTEWCWRLGWFGSSSVNHLRPAVGDLSRSPTAVSVVQYALGMYLGQWDQAQCHASRCTPPAKTKLLHCVVEQASGTVSCNQFSGLGASGITQR